MTNDIWVNLPVKDVARARSFFTKIGFKLNDRHMSDHMASFFVGDNRLIVNFFSESAFKGFAGDKIADPKQGSEVIFSIGAQTREEVDAFFKKAIDAGATANGKPGEKDGWMYGCGFSDPDGHRWSVLYMDMAKMPVK